MRAALVRHLLSVALLPFTVAVIIPWWLARRGDDALIATSRSLQLISQAVGFAVLAIGLFLFAASLRRFATEGDGTLAPWDPPRKLVLRGPYRYVRNPMISGVIFILFGEALILLTRSQLSWALTFLVANLIYIPLFEEPQLENRFGESYREYRRHVRRFIPRLRPWKPADATSTTDSGG